tara:strand:- start:125 stop:1072 length:948 start_codon:yes stop_codon:yes gene_type:complete
MKYKKNMKKLKGDASQRIFYRHSKLKSSSIYIYSKKDKKSNLLIYDAINRILLKNKILAPKLINEQYLKNFIEIEDFGNQTIFNQLGKKKVNKIKIFKEIINLLNKIQKIKLRKIKNFKKEIYHVPEYTQKILLKEAMLFSDWYVAKKLSKSKQLSFRKSFKLIIKKLIKQLLLKNDTFVHRDFHVSNLMIIKNKIGIIDSQDALFGNKAYDLASLIDDVRFKTSKKMKQKVFYLYLQTQKKLNIKHFNNDFEIISVLRNLKIIGIFTRLALRDKKNKYLKLVPYAWDLIRLRSRNNEKFKSLNKLLMVFKNFKR